MPRSAASARPGLELHGETLGRRLARLRKQRGVTQVELAAKLGAQQALISAYETGRLRLSAEMAVRLALALDVSLDELLGTRPARPQLRPPRRLLRRMELIGRLPRYRQAVLLNTIDAFLKAARQAG
jgi:transcriptional regulator with XRE-family HTH domain